jgi:chromate transporter
MSGGALAALAETFTPLSIMAVGGGNAVIPEMHRIAVDVMQWMTDKQFTDSFAIAQLSPGPNMMIVALIGYHVAGLPGAGVATLSMCGPSCVLAFGVSRVWDRFKHARWRIAVQNGLVPVSIGLIAASAFVLARATDHSVAAGVLTLLTAAVAFATRLNPLWIFGAGALAGLFGWL